ncbi:MAG TPA: triose-phosphate isomerase [Anaeromyxobacteraceae bacterium]|nr:triose-phosphate isomerase [Anaeromyxobacteraceae bacterium]
MARRKFVCGNWKMHKTSGEARTLVRELCSAVGALTDRVDVAVAPPFTALSAAASELGGSRIGLAAQNVHWEAQGAFTGEISAAMLKDAGCGYVLVGHSERRQFFGETDETVNRKARAALAAGLHPIVCVGETLPERESGRTLEVVGRQVREGLSGLGAAEVGRLTLAYEPVWAIGTGRTATSGQAQEVHAALRLVLQEIAPAAADAVRIQYGGSVKPDNAAELMAQPDVDGALVGGASLKAADFVQIVKGALR